jgi:hypothetical protein
MRHATRKPGITAMSANPDSVASEIWVEAEVDVSDAIVDLRKKEDRTRACSLH